MSDQALTVNYIGRVLTPFAEKFATPRQPGLTPEVRAQIELLPPYNDPDAIRELDSFSHLWVIFHFDRQRDQGWSPTVRPPRLGGNTRVGVFATRSPFRPNPIGLSVVSYHGHRFEGQRLLLDISGPDMVDQTPVLDIKPYVPYSDALPDAAAGFARDKPPNRLQVEFTELAESQMMNLKETLPELRPALTAILSLDPRPAYQKDGSDREYGVQLYGCNVRWHVNGNCLLVTGIEPLEDHRPSQGKSHV